MQLLTGCMVQIITKRSIIMTKRIKTFRNPVALSPLLRKSGPHVKSKTGQRFQARIAAYKAYTESVK